MIHHVYSKPVFFSHPSSRPCPYITLSLEVFFAKLSALSITLNNRATHGINVIFKSDSAQIFLFLSSVSKCNTERLISFGLFPLCHHDKMHLRKIKRKNKFYFGYNIERCIFVCLRNFTTAQVGRSVLALFSIFENLHISFDQVYF